MRKSITGYALAPGLALATVGTIAGLAVAADDDGPSTRGSYVVGGEVVLHPPRTSRPPAGGRLRRRRHGREAPATGTSWAGSWSFPRDEMQRRAAVHDPGRRPRRQPRRLYNLSTSAGVSSSLSMMIRTRTSRK